MTLPTGPALTRRTAFVTLGAVCLALVAAGCSTTRRRAWHAHTRGSYDDHMTAQRESEAIRGIKAKRDW